MRHTASMARWVSVAVTATDLTIFNTRAQPTFATSRFGVQPALPQAKADLKVSPTYGIKVSPAYGTGHSLRLRPADTQRDAPIAIRVVPAGDADVPRRGEWILSNT